MAYWQEITIWISGKRTPRLRCNTAVDNHTVKTVNQKIPPKRIYSKTLP